MINYYLYDVTKSEIDIIVFLNASTNFCFKSVAFDKPSINSKWTLFLPLWCGNNTGDAVHFGSINGSSLYATGSYYLKKEFILIEKISI